MPLSTFLLSVSDKMLLIALAVSWAALIFGVMMKRQNACSHASRSALCNVDVSFFGQRQWLTAIAVMVFYSIIVSMGFGEAESAVVKPKNMVVALCSTLALNLILIGAHYFSFQKSEVTWAESMRMRFPGFWKLMYLGPLLCVLAFLMYAILHTTGYNEWLQKLGVDPEQETIKAFKGMSSWVSVVIAIFAVVVAPITEEIMFRGLIYGVLKRYTSPLIAMVVSALFFAFIHGHAGSLMQIFILGILLVIAYEYKGSIWLPIWIHACFNGTSLLLLVVLQKYGQQLQ